MGVSSGKLRSGYYTCMSCSFDFRTIVLSFFAFLDLTHDAYLGTRVFTSLTPPYAQYFDYAQAIFEAC